MPSDLKSAFVLHAPELTRYLRRRLGSAHLASDLVQDAFVRLAEQPSGQVQDFRAYLYRVGRNLLIDHVKQERRRQTYAVPHESLAAIVDEAPSPEDAVDARLRLEKLQTIVGQLPLRTQQVFVLTRIDALTQAEAARRLGISESAVQKHLAMAIQHVTQRLRVR